MSRLVLFKSALVALALARLALDALRAARWTWRQLALSRGGADLLSRYAGGNRAWAVVTGGAKGVGRGLSRMLAKRGFSVLMLGRDQAELAAQSAAVAREFGVESAWVATDVSSAFLDDASARALLREIEAAVRGEDIAVLACIAGDSDLARHLTDKPLSRNRALLHLNCLGTLGSIQLLMPRLVQRPCRSAIITCGALTAVQGGTPGFATSSANKSYIRALSNAISREYEGQVDVICAHPLAVESNILKASKSVRGAISADAFAEGVLSRLGRDTPVRETFGTTLHELLALLSLARPMGLDSVASFADILDRPVNLAPIHDKLKLGDL
jgi:17beta-estradiol 17-dehydrogenase / very-long-chain 3-oxoacyl-CoA reductase